MVITSVVWLSWLGVFGVLELLAVTGRAPWLPLSDWTWNLERVNGLVPYLVLFALAALLVHLVAAKY